MEDMVDSGNKENVGSGDTVLEQTTRYKRKEKIREEKSEIFTKKISKVNDTFSNGNASRYCLI